MLLLESYIYPIYLKLLNDEFKKIKPKEASIGKQVWMTENLNVDKFRNGDLIPQAKTNEEWEKAGENGQPAWCYLDNDPKNGEKYGKLYNWYTVNDPRGLAPVGFHVPSNEEWQQLIYHFGYNFNATMYFGITCPNCVNWNEDYRSKVPCHKCKDTRYVAVHKLTFSDCDHKNYARYFFALGGCRYSSGYYDEYSYSGGWWSSTECDTDFAWGRNLCHDIGNVDGFDFDKGRGLSVRCLRD